MSEFWQEIGAVALVVTAALFLLKRAWNTWAQQRQAGCGSCGNCSATQDAKPLVTLDELSKSAKRFQ